MRQPDNQRTGIVAGFAGTVNESGSPRPCDCDTIVGRWCDVKRDSTHALLTCEHVRIGRKSSALAPVSAPKAAVKGVAHRRVCEQIGSSDARRVRVEPQSGARSSKPAEPLADRRPSRYYTNRYSNQHRAGPCRTVHGRTDEIRFANESDPERPFRPTRLVFLTYVSCVRVASGSGNLRKARPRHPEEAIGRPDDLPHIRCGPNRRDRQAANSVPPGCRRSARRAGRIRLQRGHETRAQPLTAPAVSPRTR